jgi:DNA repair exonuclease SbcCD nuclease subunit
MILFTADWHIKLGQKNVPVAWAKNRYNMFFEQVHEISECVDMHIIGGDLFDRMPTLEELELYFSFIREVRVPTLIFDGNHEATKKNQTFFTNLAAVTKAINPRVEVLAETREYDDFSILPYCDLHKKGHIEQLNKSKPLYTHVRGEIPPHVKPEVDLDRLSDFPIVYAGDLHSHSNTQRNIVYPGSPMTTSFHRSEVSTGYLLIDGTEWSWKEFDLPQLLRKTVTSPNEMVPTEYHHTIYEIEGDLAELANVKSSELLDKKVVKRSSEATLLLDKGMTIQEELSEYLLYILELPETTVKDVVGVFSDYAKQVNVE